MQWDWRLLEKLVQHLLEPFSSLEAVLANALHAARVFGLDANSKTALPYLLSSLLIAWLIYRRTEARKAMDAQPSFWRFAFPLDVYGHRSAIADYKFVLFDLTVRGFVFVPTLTAVGWGVYRACEAVLGRFLGDWATPDAVAAGYTQVFAVVVLADLGYYVSHYLMHRLPVLWPFHETHHSAEVLTPVTVYRVHPVEDLVNAIVGGVVLAFGAVAFGAMSDTAIPAATILGVNVVLFFYFVFAFQLRHSHIWLSYGPVLSRILISPAQHQVHHSRSDRHWNRNFGFTFAVWDWLFGSLYVPRERETIEFGVPDLRPDDFSSVGKMYLLPFRKAAYTLRGRST